MTRFILNKYSNILNSKERSILDFCSFLVYYFLCFFSYFYSTDKLFTNRRPIEKCVKYTKIKFIKLNESFIYIFGRKVSLYKKRNSRLITSNNLVSYKDI